MQPGGISVVTQSAEPTKHYEIVVRQEEVPVPQSRFRRVLRKLLRRADPVKVIEVEELVEIVPQEPPQAMRGHVALMGKQ